MRRDVNALQDRNFDLLVIGGGMHGAWIALRAVQVGLKVALIEKDDFGGATTANSLKILHGGLRYLQHLDYRRMRSSIAARREFARRSPHLFEPLACLLPLKGLGLKNPPALGVALLLNELVSAGRNDGVAREAQLPRGKLVSAAACREAMSPLAPTAAVAGALWWDGLAKDTARLALDPLLEAAAAGATVANRVSAERYLLHSGRVHGVEVLDALEQRRFEIRARVIVNATGPWIGELSRQAGLTEKYLPPAWIGGLNVVLRRSLGITSAIALTTAQAGGGKRELFFVPWRGVTMVGTHYVPIGSGALPASAPRAATEAFLDSVARAAPHARVSMEDVALLHWGALPLAARGDPLPARLPTLIAGPEETGARGLVLLAAEKLTSAPQLSIRVMARILADGLVPPAPQGAPLAAAMPEPDGAAPGLSAPVVARLAARYGRGWARVAGHAASDPTLLERISPDCEVLRVEIVHAIREEMALTMDDLVMRRLGLGDAGPPGARALEACAALAAAEWSTGQSTLAMFSR